MNRPSVIHFVNYVKFKGEKSTITAIATRNLFYT